MKKEPAKKEPPAAKKTTAMTSDPEIMEVSRTDSSLSLVPRSFEGHIWWI